MIKIVIVVILAILLAVGGKSYYRTKQANEIAAKQARLEAEAKEAEESKARELLAEQARLQQAQKAEDEATLTAAKLEIERRVKDPGSIQYRNLKVVGSDVCGEVNAKNGFGAYVGYRRFIYALQQIQFEPDSDATPKQREFFEYGVFLSCTPKDELEVICKSNPVRCNVPSLR